MLPCSSPMCAVDSRSSIDGTSVAVSRWHGDNWPARSREKLDRSINAFTASEIGTYLVIRALKMAVGAYHVGFWDGHIFLNSCKRIMPLTEPKRNICRIKHVLARYTFCTTLASTLTNAHEWSLSFQRPDKSSHAQHHKELPQRLSQRLFAVFAHPARERIPDINPGIYAVNDGPVAGLAECQRYMIRAAEARNIQHENRDNPEALHGAPSWRRRRIHIARTFSAGDLRARDENQKESHHDSSRERDPLLGGKPPEPRRDGTRVKMPRAEMCIGDANQHQCRRNRGKCENCVENDSGWTRGCKASALGRIRRFPFEFQFSDTSYVSGTVYTNSAAT